jgi:hypothetical protein
MRSRKFGNNRRDEEVSRERRKIGHQTGFSSCATIAAFKLAALNPPIVLRKTRDLYRILRRIDLFADGSESGDGNATKALFAFLEDFIAARPRSRDGILRSSSWLCRKRNPFNNQ